MVIDAVLQAGETFGVGTWLAFENDRPAVRKDQPVPDQQHAALTELHTGGILTDKIKEFITQKYAGARIIESDMEKGMTEVEIFHEGREKDVYFNGAQDWVRTEWGVRVNELPAAVLDVIRKTYADYRIDDADYVETRTESYYLVELERGENEVDLRILPNGTIL